MYKRFNKIPYLVVADSYIGVTEIKGKLHNPIITDWLAKLGAWWSDDETAWCGTFVANCLNKTGYPIPKHWYRARAYLDYGIPINEAKLGCLAIFSRKCGGHVGFVVGIEKNGNLLILGGNQNDAVNIMSYSKDRLLGLRAVDSKFTGAEYCVPVITR